MVPRERLLDLLNRKPVDRVPTFSAGCSQTATVECMESIDVFWPEAHRESNKMARLAASVHPLTGIEVAAVPFCMTIEAEAFGCELKWTDKVDAVPMVVKSPYNVKEDIAVPNEFLNLKRIPVVIDAVRILGEVKERVPVVAGVTGPFTLAGHLRGAENLYESIILDPGRVKSLTNVCTDATVIFGRGLREAGADVISIAEPSASGSMLNNKMFKNFVKPFLQRAVMEIGGLTMLHICGDAMPMLDDMADTGVTGISIDETVDVGEAKKIIDDRAFLIGNVSCGRTLLLGTPEQVKKESLDALEKGIDILAPGCGVPPRTPNANLRAMAEAALEFKK
jgi:MtaA/CmuA family methyltransferase